MITLSEIGGEIIVIGKTIIRFDSVGSTNNYIKSNSSLLEEGTVVVSKIQTSGRGRSNHSWMSDEGNLYFSFLINGYISRSKIFELLAKVSNTVIRLLRDFNIKSEIKYPNDILIEDKKICGILIESYGALEIDYVVVGVGINVNQLDFRDLNDKATSMKKILGINTEVEQVLEKFIEHYNVLENIPFTEIFNDYLKYSLIIGKRTNYNGETCLIKGITETGKMIIEKSDVIKYINLNEINIKDLF